MFDGILGLSSVCFLLVAGNVLLLDVCLLLRGSSVAGHVYHLVVFSFGLHLVFFCILYFEMWVVSLVEIGGGGRCLKEL